MESRREQFMRALAEANRIRGLRTDLKRRIERGETAAEEVIDLMPEEAFSWEVMDFLMAQPSWGRRRALRALAQVPLPETKPLGTLTERQRDVLVLAVRRCQTEAMLERRVAA